jgi:hypothetical protein
MGGGRRFACKFLIWQTIRRSSRVCVTDYLCRRPAAPVARSTPIHVRRTDCRPVHYAAKLLFIWNSDPITGSRAKRLCEERILTFQARSATEAVRKASRSAGRGRCATRVAIGSHSPGYFNAWNSVARPGRGLVGVSAALESRRVGEEGAASRRPAVRAYRQLEAKWSCTAEAARYGAPCDTLAEGSAQVAVVVLGGAPSRGNVKSPTTWRLSTARRLTRGCSRRHAVAS